jgi:hypothetical protein
VRFELLPADYVQPAEPEWVTVTEQAVAGCPKHAWLLNLDEDGEASLACEHCPACVDDLYPDGVDMIYFETADGIIVDAGTHDAPDDRVPLSIPVNAWVLTSRDYWGEYDVEMFIEPKEDHDSHT